MRISPNRCLNCALTFALAAASAFAQDAKAIKAEFLANFDDTSKKIVSLAEAVPAEKYSWKPQDGVRSIAQVYVHLTLANYAIPVALGAKMPTDGSISRDMEKTMTDKAKIVPALKKAMENARMAIETGMNEPSKATKLFGKDSTNSAAALLVITHMHEHLGQSIAYARSNGVTPPWSGGQ